MCFFQHPTAALLSLLQSRSVNWIYASYLLCNSWWNSDCYKICILKSNSFQKCFSITLFCKRLWDKGRWWIHPVVHFSFQYSIIFFGAAEFTMCFIFCPMLTEVRTWWKMWQIVSLCLDFIDLWRAKHVAFKKQPLKCIKWWW